MDHYQRSARNAFSACAIDRQTELRCDVSALRALAESDHARFLLVHDHQCLLHASDNKLLLLPQPPTASDYCYLGQRLDQKIDLKLEQKQAQPLFAAQLPAAEAKQHGLDGTGRWIDLRTAAGWLSDEEAGIVAYAIAMFNWQRRHRFCGSCGSSNQIQDGGHRLRCSNELCAQITFPRIDPAMITLVEHDDAILLGRQDKWPARRYSTLAGFAEPGESIEDAVRREVLEEVGVRLEQIHYHSSQPWPFPGSLMLGFRTTAQSTQIRLGAELCDARWWTLREFEQAVRSRQLLLSMPQSIAFALISDWYLERTSRALHELLPAAD